MLLAVLLAACDPTTPVESLSPAASGPVRWQLPDKLREISGLALTGDQRLLAVTDEEAIVYEYDFSAGRLIKAFALGNPTLRGDFEGIAVLNDIVWLMTSNGDLFSFTEGSDGERVEYEQHEPVFADDCELEGMAADTANGTLILVCKDAKKKKDRLLYEWTPGGGAREYRLPELAIARRIGKKRVHPSAIELNVESDQLVVAAARENILFSLSRSGEFIDVIMQLDTDLHRQAEGIAVTHDGRLIIADESVDGPATLSIYSSNYGSKK